MWQTRKELAQTVADPLCVSKEFVVGAVTADKLNANRQSLRTGRDGHIDQGQVQQCPQPAEHRIARKSTELNRFAHGTRRDEQIIGFEQFVDAFATADGKILRRNIVRERCRLPFLDEGLKYMSQTRSMFPVFETPAARCLKGHDGRVRFRETIEVLGQLRLFDDGAGVR